MKLTIKGRVISKKNSRRNFGNVSLPSLAFENFKSHALHQLRDVKAKFDRPVYVRYTFKLKGKMRQDCDNAMASVNDVLQDAGIIADDNLIVEGYFKKVQGFTDFETEVEIEEV